MHAILLGTAAGGGFPQWNCDCPNCAAARRDPERARPRTQSALAVSADGHRWFLCNASPDVREQLLRLPRRPSAGVRSVPIEGVVLTDAELDHSLGILLLREARRLSLYASPRTLEILELHSRILPVTRSFAEVSAHELALDRPIELRDRDGVPSGLSVEPFAVPGDAPRFAPTADGAAGGETVGLCIRDPAGRTTLYIPGCASISDNLLARLAAMQADALLFDGTFWSEDEMIDLHLGERRATAMGHIPISGPSGSLAQLAKLPIGRRIYTHINNTNPVLLVGSRERETVEAAGWIVGEDGMTV